MPGYRRKPAEKKQKQESLPAGERTDKLELRGNYYHPGQAGKCLIEEQDILKRWTEYCSELYTQTTGDPQVLDVPPPIDNDSYPILREEVEAAVKSLKKGKSAGVDNIPSELGLAGGEAMIDRLLIICNEVWQTVPDHHSPK